MVRRKTPRSRGDIIDVTSIFNPWIADERGRKDDQSAASFRHHLHLDPHLVEMSYYQAFGKQNRDRSWSLMEGSLFSDTYISAGAVGVWHGIGIGVLFEYWSLHALDMHRTYIVAC